MSEKIEKVDRVRRAQKVSVTVRLTRLARERLRDLSEGSERSEAVLLDDAIIEYFRRHPEFWPDRLFPGFQVLKDQAEASDEG